MQNKNVLITGGSAGIGFEISKHFAKDGYSIFWITLFEEEANNAKSELQNLYPNVKVDYLIQDLSKCDGAENGYNWYKQKNIQIDVLVNNAGVANYGYIHLLELEKESKVIELNVLSLYKITRLFLNDMTEKNQGTIINLSSSSSFQPVPKLAVYAATKSFVSSFSQALSEEMKQNNLNINVISVYPAAIKDTKFKTSAKMEKVKTFDGLFTTTVKEVASDLWTAFENKQEVVVTGKKYRNSKLFESFIPKALIKYLLKQEMSEVS